MSRTPVRRTRTPRTGAARACRRDLPLVVTATLARTVAWTALALVLWAVLPAALGAHVTTVASDSMAPGIRRGDAVAALPTTSEQVGEPSRGRVLLVRDPDHEGRLRLHRLVEVDDEGRLHLKGDANDARDTSSVAPDDVLGTGFLRVPWVGLPGLWVADRSALPLTATVLVAVALLGLARLDRHVLRGTPCPACGAPRSSVVPEERTPTGPALLGATSVLVVASLVAVATPSSAAFSATTDGASTLGTATSYPCYRHHDDGDAVLAWDFDEARGVDVVDRTGHGADGVMTGGAGRRDASCAGDPALSLSGQDAGRVDVPAATTGPSRFTVSAWFRTDRPEGRVVGFSSDRTSASTYKDRHLYLDASGHVRFGVQGAANGFRFTVGSPAAVADGTWHHAVGVSEPGRLELWVDGQRVGNRTDLTSSFAYEGHWRVGRESLDPWPGQPASYAFTGEIDTVRVWDRPLAAAEVQALHAQGR